MVIKILTKRGKRMDEHSENFKREMENIGKYQIEVTEFENTVIEFKKYTTDIQQMKQKKGSIDLNTRQWSSPRRAKR